MKKYLCGIAAIGLTVALYGCQKPVEKPVSETSEPLLLNNEISITQEGLNMTGNTIQLPSGEAAATSALDSAADALNTISTDAPTPQNIQQALINAGLYQGQIDGDIGPRTKKAIKEFQAQNSLKIDGKVGPKTWEKLAPYLSQGTTSALPDPTQITTTQNISN